MSNRMCETCGESIYTRRSHARYCSPKCRAAGNRARKTEPVLPVELTGVPRWVRWEPVMRNGRVTKVPRTVNGRAADVTDPACWSTFAEASASGARVGFVLTGEDDISCIDLDGVLSEDGQPAPGVAELIKDTSGVFYVERSVSGRGLHLWHRGPSGHGSRRVENGLSVERYSRDRFIALGTRFELELI